MSLLPPYNELVIHIIRYFTYEGRFSCLHAHHFKLLSYVRHNFPVNVPNFLYNMLCISAEETQKGKDNFVTHHALIKFLIERSLRDASPMSWEEIFQCKTLQPQAAPNEQPSEENATPIDGTTEKSTQDAETRNMQENVPLPAQMRNVPTSAQARIK